MTSRNYRSIRQVRQSIDYDLDQWAASAETSLAVAAAIHAISDSKRSADAIWQDPTAAEVEHVTMAVQEYRSHGDFEPTIGEDDGNYLWGGKFYVSPFPVATREARFLAQLFAHLCARAAADGPNSTSADLLRRHIAAYPFGGRG